MVEYIFCPKCGNKLETSAKLPHCNKCNITYYRNAKPCAGVLPLKDGKVLLSRRGIAPYKGAYDIIGGFMEEDELPEAAAVREAKEETGLDIKITSLIGIYSDRYGSGGDHTLNIHYTGEITGGKMQPMDDVASLEWIDIKDLPVEGGFENTKQCLSDFKKLYAQKLT